MTGITHLFYMKTILIQYILCLCMCLENNILCLGHLIFFLFDSNMVNKYSCTWLLNTYSLSRTKASRYRILICLGTLFQDFMDLSGFK